MSIQERFIELSDNLKRNKLTLGGGMKLDIVKWSHGTSLYLNDFRISGSKPWGGGKVFMSFDVEEEDLLEAIRQYKHEPVDQYQADPNIG